MDIFSIFFNMKVVCVFSLESPHSGDSNKYTQYTIFNIRRKNRPKLSQICTYGIFPLGLKHEFETAMVNEPSVIEPLNFYCKCCSLLGRIVHVDQANVVMKDISATNGVIHAIDSVLVPSSLATTIKNL